MIRKLCYIHDHFVELLLAVFLLFLSSSAVAQYDTLLHRPYGETVLGIHAMYEDLINIPDSTARAEKAEEIKAFARKHKDRRLELNVDFFLVFWNAFFLHQPKEVSHRTLVELVDRFTKENVDFLRARSLRALAEFYWKIEKNYQRAFEQYLLLDNEISGANPRDYPEMARDLMQIGKAYYFFHDYPLAIKYFKRAIALPENSFTTGVINDARNTLGLSYQQLGRLDSADYYFNRVLETKFGESAAWKRIAIGNLGADLYLGGHYDKAIPLLEEDFYGAEKEHDLGAAAGSAIPLADIYRMKGDLSRAKIFWQKAEEYIEEAKQPERLRLLYPVMSKWYADIGDKENAKRYVDSAIVATNRYNAEYSALKVLRAQQEVDRQKEELQEAAYTLEWERKASERNLLILLVIILCIGIALTYFIQKKRQLTKDLSLQAATQELEMARISLNSYTESIREKNELIEQLQHQGQEAEQMGIYQQLQQSTILTEEDWNTFQQLFDKAYPGFIQRLKDKYIELSMGELRYFVLSRLNLSTREMAAMLGVSPNAVQVMRHRIRKKLDLADGISLEEVVKQI